MHEEGGRGQPGGFLLWWQQREPGLTGLVPQAAGLHGYCFKSPCPSPPPPQTRGTEVRAAYRGGTWKEARAPALIVRPLSTEKTGLLRWSQRPKRKDGVTEHE